MKDRKCPKKKPRQVPKGFAARTALMLGAGAIVLGREVGSAFAKKIRDTPEIATLQLRVKQTQDLVKALSSLKGAAMKAGQLISLEMSDLLPPEVIAVLRTLLDNASFMPYSDIVRVLNKELGKKRVREITDFSMEPIAAASIGQVHSGTIRGKSVALKIQYPGVAESIDSDLALFRKIIGAVLVLKNKAISLDGLFEELNEGLKREVDYFNEAKCLNAYRNAFSHLKQYIIPSIYPDFSTSKVLTLSFESGTRLNDWIKGPLSAEDKVKFADLILGLLFHEVFETGHVQTDPNYGNFLIRKEGPDLKLVLLDFGAMKTYPQKFRADIRDILRAAMTGDREETLRMAINLSLLDLRESQESKDYFIALMNKVIFMFRKENQPFSFSNVQYLSELRKITLGFAEVVKYTSPAKHMIFLNRKLGGMFHLLKDAEVEIDLSGFWQRVMDLELLPKT